MFIVDCNCVSVHNALYCMCVGHVIASMYIHLFMEEVLLKKLQVHSNISKEMQETKNTFPDHIRWIDIIELGLLEMQKRYNSRPVSSKPTKPEPPAQPKKRLTLEERLAIVRSGGVVPMDS